MSCNCGYSSTSSVLLCIHSKDFKAKLDSPRYQNELDGPKETRNRNFTLKMNFLHVFPKVSCMFSGSAYAYIYE